MRPERRLFGNNFYTYFHARKRIVDRVALPIHQEKYARISAEPRWQEFCNENSLLLENISLALSVVDEVLKYHSEERKSLARKKWEEADDYEEERNTDQIDQLSYDAWNCLYILLEQAAHIMERYDIVPTKYFS